MLRLVIDDRAADCREGATILDALRAAKVAVPTLCHDSRLSPYGGCRLCLVQVAGHSKPVTACTTPVADGMQIETHTPDLESLRRALLKLIAGDYPMEAYRRDPDKEFHRYIREYSLEQELKGHGDPTALDDSHPYIRVDMSQCVYCYRCVRICDEVQGQFVWQVWNRGDRTRILPDGPTLLESSCVSCGACVDTCPSGALEDRSRLEKGAPTSWVRTTCPYCGVGCEMSVGTRAGRIVAVKPIDDAPVSKGHLCVKGRYAFSFVSAPDRVMEPMIRHQGTWNRVSWDAAIQHVVDRFRSLLNRSGPQSVGVLGSARATNEDNYLAQKFARVVLGTNNVDCCARVCHAPSAAALKEMLGTGAGTNSFDDIEHARAFLVCGANPTENHPIVGARIKQAALKGARLIVIDPRRTELVGYADYHLAPRPGTNIPLLNALANTIVKETLWDRAFLSTRVDDVAAFQTFVEPWTAEHASEITGVDAGLIREAARLYASEKPAMSVHGLGLTEHLQGTEAVMALVNLALLTGNIGRPGSGVNPLRGQNNVQGAAQMGCEPATLTGAQPLASSRELFGRVWRASLPQAKGLRLLEMMDGAVAGRFNGLWAIGYDILLTNPNAAETHRALAALELLVVQDLFLNETARTYAHVFLPACSSFEKDGTFMNAERRVQRVRQALSPLGQSKPDWEIICAVAKAMGKGDGFDFDRPEEIWDEVRAVWPAGRGISYGRLDQEGLRWPCPSEEHPGTDILHRERFVAGPRARLRCIDFSPTVEHVSDEFPLLLTTGRTLYQFNAGTMTSRTPNVVLRPTDVLDMATIDATRLSCTSGDRVRVVSRYGSAVLPVRIADTVKSGELFASFQTADVFLNHVIGSQRDPICGTPEYKVTAVRVEHL